VRIGCDRLDGIRVASSQRGLDQTHAIVKVIALYLFLSDLSVRRFFSSFFAASSRGSLAVTAFFSHFALPFNSGRPSASENKKGYSRMLVGGTFESCSEAGYLEDLWMCGCSYHFTSRSSRI
jgi:hypothetical protein